MFPAVWFRLLPPTSGLRCAFVPYAVMIQLKRLCNLLDICPSLLHADLDPGQVDYRENHASSAGSRPLTQ